MKSSKKVLALVVSIFVLAGILPMVSALPTAFFQGFPRASQGMPYAVKANDFKLPFYGHRTGSLLVPLSKYEQITGVHFETLDAKALADALKNIHTYPGRNIRSSYVILPNGFAVLNTSVLPSAAVNTLYLPPVGNQGYVGSCNAWSSTYYVWTYMINWWRNNPHPHTASDIMNPTFTYNLINGGEDWGSIPWDAMNLIGSIGAVPLSDFPLYNSSPLPEDYAWVWPNLTQWEEAPHNSANFLTYLGGLGYVVPGMWYTADLTNDTQWNYTKALLAKGYVLQTTINVLPSFQFLDHPESLLGYMNFYAYFISVYSQEYWTNQSFENGTYTNWTVGNVLDYAASVYYNTTTYYNELYNISIFSTNATPYINLMKTVLTKFNVSVNDSVGVAVSKIETGLNTMYLNNQSWWDNATFYLSTYSINGEKWLLNHGFDALYTLANFEWMLHYIPIGQYSSWPWYYLNFNNYYSMFQGGHAVTIIGYNNTAVTPDGQGALVMVNSWGTGWGDNGYWKFSYQAIRSAGNNFNVSIDGVFNTSFQIEWPTIYGGSTAFVYVPKAANYTPTAMITLGIKHPLRGEIIDGVFDYLNGETVSGGIPVAVYAVEGNQKEELWGQSFLNFMIDEIWANTTTPVNLSTWAIPQAHPFPNSPMAFDITGALESLSYYVNSGHSLPTALEVSVMLSDKVIDNYTGSVYEYGLTVMTPDGHQIQVSKNDIKVAIPQGKYINLTIKIPLAQMKKYVVSTPFHSISLSKFKVTAVTLVKPEAAYLYMQNEFTRRTVRFQMSTTDGFYYQITGSELRGLRSAPYRYWVVFIYSNGQELKLPMHNVNIVVNRW